MQVQSIFPGKNKKIQTVGMAAFIGAVVLFALGVILMLTTEGLWISRQLPLILMTIAAIDICFAAALSAQDMPEVEKTRLRTLSVIGSVIVVIAATLIATSFKAGVFQIVIMLVALGGAPGMFKLGEIVGARLSAADDAPAKPAAKAAAPETAAPAETTTTATSSTEGSPAA